MLNPMAAQGPCIVAGSGTVPNDEQVSDPVEMRLLIILSCVDRTFQSDSAGSRIYFLCLAVLFPETSIQPVGVGFSYGPKSTIAVPPLLMCTIFSKSSSVYSLTLLGEYSVSETI
jgi:hypothetical protein